MHSKFMQMDGNGRQYPSTFSVLVPKLDLDGSIKRRGKNKEVIARVDMTLYPDKYTYVGTRAQMAQRTGK